MQLDLDFGVCALDDYDEDDHAQIQTDSPGVDGSEGTQPAERLMPSGFYSHVGSIGPNPIVFPTPIATVAKAIESQHLKAT